jgi:hypothetical protein
LFFFGVVISSFAFAQSFQGTLRGRVLDPNGATTAAAAITSTGQAIDSQKITDLPILGRNTVDGISIADSTNRAVIVLSPEAVQERRRNTTLTNTQFGLITSQINNPRLLQLGTRITF